MSIEFFYQLATLELMQYDWKQPSADILLIIILALEKLINYNFITLDLVRYLSCAQECLV